MREPPHNLIPLQHLRYFLSTQGKGKWKQLRTRMQLGPASLSEQWRQNSSWGGAPKSAAAPINHVRLQCLGHKLLFVHYRDGGCQFLVDAGSTVTLWPQAWLSRNARPINVALTSDSGNKIVTYGSTMRELNLGGQLFSHTFICA